MLQCFKIYIVCLDDLDCRGRFVHLNVVSLSFSVTVLTSVLLSHCVYVSPYGCDSMSPHGLTVSLCLLVVSLCLYVSLSHCLCLTVSPSLSLSL